MVAQSLKKSLANLGVAYIDSWVLHSPFPSISDTLLAWNAMETGVAAGSVRQLGLSNCYDLKTFSLIYDAAKVKPRVLQNRFYRDSGYDRDLRKFCAAHNVSYQSFWTLSANPMVLQSSPVARAQQWLAKELRRPALTKEQAFFRLLIDMGISPLTGTTSPEHMADDYFISQTAASMESGGEVKRIPRDIVESLDELLK
jgi:diketogulonate reductase-like aldo/keto reductase